MDKERVLTDNQLKWMAAEILANAIKDPDYVDAFKSGNKKKIRRIVVQKLYEKGIYCKTIYRLFKGYYLTKCSKEDCEKYLKNE